jgi:steroid delta-isomerase-like uncharacterized protein
MSNERNVAALEKARRCWNQGDLEGYLALYHPDAILQGYAGVAPGIASIRHFYETFWEAFPGSRLVFEDVMEQGVKVACRFLVSGIHRGIFQGIAATGREIALPGITILEFSEGKCARRWSYADAVGLLQQLGALPRG